MTKTQNLKTAGTRTQKSERLTAGQRTRGAKRTLEDAGYKARVTSSPASHRAYQTIIDQSESLEEIAAYLGGFYREDGTEVKLYAGFVAINWADPDCQAIA
jgi:hypothetical protein